MTKYISLFGGTTTDTTVQVAKENQIIIGYGPYMAMNRYVVYKVEHTADGYMYHLLNLETKKTDRTDILQPLSRKHGIGRYYDDKNPQFMDPFEVALLVEEAEKQAAAEARQAEQERQRVARVEAVGRERFAAILPPTAKAVIVAELREDESDHMTDYFAYRTVRTIILGFSSHTRDLFSEMRKYASNLPETAYLAEPREEYDRVRQADDHNTRGRRHTPAPRARQPRIPRHAGEVRRSAFIAYAGGRSDLRAAVGVLLARVCRTALCGQYLRDIVVESGHRVHDIRLRL